MMYSIGIDIVRIARITRLMERHEDRFLDKVFSAEEKKQILRKSSVHRNESMAGRFAAKEAIIKALGKFFDRGVYFSDIGIVTDASGQPSVALAEKLTERMHGARILISIAHDGEYAIAQALIVSEDQHEK